MSKFLGSVLAGLIVLNGGLATLPMEAVERVIVTLAVSVAIASLSFYLKGPTAP